MDRERLVSRVPEGLLMVGLGSIWLSDWWWPGILVVFGIAQGAADLLRKRHLRAAVVMLFFFGIPIASAAGVSWRFSVPLVLILIGMIGIIKAFLLELSSGTRDSATDRPVGSYAVPFSSRSVALTLMVQLNRFLWK